MCVRLALRNTRLKMYGKEQKVKIVEINKFFDYKVTIHHFISMACISNEWQNSKITFGIENIKIGLELYDIYNQSGAVKSGNPFLLKVTIGLTFSISYGRIKYWTNGQTDRRKERMINREVFLRRQYFLLKLGDLNSCNNYCFKYRFASGLPVLPQNVFCIYT